MWYKRAIIENYFKEQSRNIFKKAIIEYSVKRSQKH